MEINQPNPSPNLSYQPQITQNEVKPTSLTTILKLIYILGFASLFIFGLIFLIKRFFIKKPSLATGILVETRYQSVLWRDFGEVFEPIIKIPIYYQGKGYSKEEFLLDSGAVVSSLPREKAEEMGFSLAKLPRSTFSGFGGTTSFAYKASVKLMLGDQEVTIPVVFTEAGGTKSILGRSGFFENYSVYFNSKEEKIEISN